MDFTDFPPGAASLAYADGVTIMDTSISGTDTFAGWVSGPAITSGFPVLDRAAGVQVNFTLQLESEMHTRIQHAGFNLILLDQNATGIELAFWENEIWAQNDDHTGGMFAHGEGIAFSTTAGLADYQLTMIEDTYTLTANSQVLLSGPVRDYSPFEGFPDPYETPNFLFFGDNSTSAQARPVAIRFHHRDGAGASCDHKYKHNKQSPANSFLHSSSQCHPGPLINPRSARNCR